jgi:hypothetical protein
MSIPWVYKEMMIEKKVQGMLGKGWNFSVQWWKATVSRSSSGSIYSKSPLFYWHLTKVLFMLETAGCQIPFTAVIVSKSTK